MLVGSFKSRKLSIKVLIYLGWGVQALLSSYLFTALAAARPFRKISLNSALVSFHDSFTVTQGIKKDWMTGESTFGELKDGTVTRCSLGLCRQ